jgi:hypothetical protein
MHAAVAPHDRVLDEPSTHQCRCSCVYTSPATDPVHSPPPPPPPRRPSSSRSPSLGADAKPTNQELPIYNIVADTLNKQNGVMKALVEYKGCQDLARKAMSSPTPENEAAAFEGLLNSVDSVALFYNYAKELEKITPDLLTTLTKDGADCKASLSDQQALAKQLAGQTTRGPDDRTRANACQFERSGLVQAFR